jgi:hypothetical protein
MGTSSKSDNKIMELNFKKLNLTVNTTECGHLQIT